MNRNISHLTQVSLDFGSEKRWSPNFLFIVAFGQAGERGEERPNAMIPFYSGPIEKRSHHIRPRNKLRGQFLCAVQASLGHLDPEGNNTGHVQLRYRNIEVVSCVIFDPALGSWKPVSLAHDLQDEYHLRPVASAQQGLACS